MGSDSFSPSRSWREQRALWAVRRVIAGLLVLLLSTHMGSASAAPSLLIPKAYCSYAYDDRSNNALQAVDGAEINVARVSSSTVSPSDFTMRRMYDARQLLRFSRSSMATNSGAMAESGTVDASRVRFTQDSVSPNFKAGGSVEDLTAGLKNGSIKPGSVEPIRIFERDGQWYSLDNRRLLAFQNAGVEVPYRVATPAEVAAEGFKMTSTNGGASVRVRGGGK